MKLTFPLFGDPDLSNKAGDATIGGTFLVNHAFDNNYTTLFQTAAASTMSAFSLAMAINVANWGYVGFNGTLWSSDPVVGKKFTVSFNATR
jgi:hypothetical protein